MSNDASDEQGERHPGEHRFVEQSTPDPLFDPAQLRIAEFRRTIFALTPRIFVTYALVAMNVAVFGLMCFNQIDLMSPNTDDMIAWGANFGPLTIDGQWWRLVTSMFLHFGVVHLGLNMYVLYADGPLMERLLGNVGFAVMYVVSGICGSIASLFWNPLAVSAGASGAIFGLFGAMLGSLVRHQGSIPPQISVQLRNGGLLFLVVNVVFGFTQPNIDQAAHLGGFAGGFVCGVLMGRKYTGEAAAQRTLGNVLVAVFGVVVFFGGTLAAKHYYGGVPTAYEALEGYDEVNARTFDMVAAFSDRSEKEQLSDEDAADFFEKEILPEWNARREALLEIARIPTALREQVDLRAEYMTLRSEEWQLYVAAVRTQDVETTRQFEMKHEAADAAMKRLHPSP